MSKARRIEQYMTPAPYTIDHKATLAAAHRLMREHLVRHLPVVGEDGGIVGVVSMHDLHLLETLSNVDQDEVPVEDAMTEEPYTVEPDTLLTEVVQEMIDNKYGSVLVMRGEELAGLFTTIDALRALRELLGEARSPASG